MNSNQKGEIAKLKVELRATEKGWIVSRTTEGSRYDLVLDDGKKLYRVQVKYCNDKTGNSEGAIQVGLRKPIGDDRNHNAKYCRKRSRRFEGSKGKTVLLTWMVTFLSGCRP